MLVLVLIIVTFVLLRDLSREAPATMDDVTEDYKQTAAYASEQADFDVLAPRRLPPGWKVTSVEFVPDPVRWHLGLLTETEEYVGLEQSESSEKDMVTTHVDEAPQRSADVAIDGETWDSWTDARGDTALVRTDGPVTTLVVGPVDRDELVGFVRGLR